MRWTGESGREGSDGAVADSTDVAQTLRDEDVGPEPPHERLVQRVEGAGGGQGVAHPAVGGLARELAAVDRTPVLDIKPVMREFLPRGQVRQPRWSSELMQRYWSNGGSEDP